MARQNGMISFMLNKLFTGTTLNTLKFIGTTTDYWIKFCLMARQHGMINFMLNKLFIGITEYTKAYWHNN